VGRPPARAHLARPAAVALAVAALFVIFAAPASAGWGHPLRLAAPVSLDIGAPAASLSPSGNAAISFTVQDEDAHAIATAYTVWRRGKGGTSRPYVVPGSKQVLAQAFNGRTLELLTGSSAASDSCCSSAGVVDLRAGGRFGKPRTLVSGLGGATVGDLVTVGRRTLAAIATERGVWVSQSSPSGRFGRTRRLAGAGAAPQSLAATALGTSGAVVAWSGGKTSVIGPRSIYVARGTGAQAPGRAHQALKVPGTDGIDELAVAAGRDGATLAWIHSWYDRRGDYRSGAAVADLGRRLKVTTFRLPGLMASGLTFGADAHGDQTLAWKACSWSGSCSVRVAVRQAGKGFGQPARAGTVDATELPAVAVAPAGQALLGWIDGGHVLASYLRPHATRFGSPARVSSTTFAADLTLAFRASGQAIAAWSQGTLSPELVGALFSSR
jgi:hypothetical protein